MLIIGITGKSGSGKSTICKYISDCGYKIIDIDRIHKDVSNRHMNKIYEIFAYMGYGELSHNEKVELFFENKIIREKINNETFKETISEVNQNINTSKENLIFLDAPLLFEMKLNKLCNFIWLVRCNKEINIQRLINRNDVTYQKAISRYDAIDIPNEEDYYDLILASSHNNTKIIKERIYTYEQCNLCRKF